MAPDDPFQRPLEPVRTFSKLEGSQITRAHAMLQEIVRVSQSSRALVVIREASRSGPNNTEVGIALATFGGLFLLTHWWIALPASLIVGFWRTRRRALKLRRQAKANPYALPDAPEFKNLWAVHCWKFTPMVRGFNLRAEATNRLIRDGKKLDSARRMAALLDSFRQDLEDAWQLLYQLRPHKTAVIPLAINLKVSQSVNDRLTMIDPLGLATGSVEFDWLALETDHITPDRFDEVLERDEAWAIHAQEEINGSTTEAIFEALKRKLDNES